MKYTYTGDVPTVCLVNGDLVQVNKGEIVEIDQPPSPEFSPVETPIAQDPPKKPKKKRVVKNATTTNTSSVG